MSHVLDLGALGPYYDRYVEMWWQSRGARLPANTYFVTCPESLKPLPIVNGVVRPASPEETHE